jgi:DNA-nicking Smr family endonuclease
MRKKNRPASRPQHSQTLVNEEDSALFREAIGPVKRMNAQESAIDKPKPEAAVRSLDADERQALIQSHTPDWNSLAELMGEALAYRRNEVTEATFKRLKRGSFAVQDEFDLHGMSTSQAEQYLKTFLHEAIENEHSCVRVVHGKGLRSESGLPVMKALVDRLLRHHGHVLAFSSAPAAQGGTGATLVLLRRR